MRLAKAAASGAWKGDAGEGVYVPTSMVAASLEISQILDMGLASAIL